MTKLQAVVRRLPVLLIDDSPDDRAAYREVLTEAGFSVQEVADPLSAYQQAVVDVPAVIVADIRMPGPLNGIEVMRKLKSTKPRARFRSLRSRVILTTRRALRRSALAPVFL